MSDSPANAADAIPDLDLGPLLRSEPDSIERLAASLRRVLMEVGFFSISGHGVPEDTVLRVFAASRRFHALPIERKEAIAIDRNSTGYMGLNRSRQNYSAVDAARKPNFNESFFCSRERAATHPGVVAGVQFQGRNQWPADLPGFREDVLAYQAAVERLALRLLPPLAVALELPPDWFAPYFTEPDLNLRLIHYPARDESEPNQFGSNSHTDGGFLTFLMQHEIGGLQIRRTDGVWIDAPVLPGRFIVNSGNILRRWTNDRFLSTPHRVLNLSGTDRYSIAFFISPDLDTVLECIPTCTGPDTPPRHEPVTWREERLRYLRANYANQGAKV